MNVVLYFDHFSKCRVLAIHVQGCLVRDATKVMDDVLAAQT